MFSSWTLLDASFSPLPVHCKSGLHLAAQCPVKNPLWCRDSQGSACSLNAPDSHAGPVLAQCGGSAEKHPMKCAGVAGRRVRTPGYTRRWVPAPPICSTASQPLLLAADAQQLLALVACLGADAVTRAHDLAHAPPHFITAVRGGGVGAACFPMHAGWSSGTACVHRHVSRCLPSCDCRERHSCAQVALLIGQQSTD